MSRQRKWTSEEIVRIQDEYASHAASGTLASLASSMGRSKHYIARIARRLGLTDRRRPKTWLASDWNRNRESRRVLFDEFLAQAQGPRRFCEARKLPPSSFSRVMSAEFPSEWREAIRTRSDRGKLKNTHPRGDLGMKHTPEAKAKMGRASKARWLVMSSGQRESRRLKILSTNLAKYGMGNAGFRGSNAHSRTKSGKRADLGGLFLRSAWEANYARYLRWLKKQGQIRKWEYEADTFVFHGETRGSISYTPDFKVTEKDGSVVYHEVKGWMDPKSKSKLKRMKKHYPEVPLILIDEKAYREIAKWAGLIPFWEGRDYTQKRATG